MTGFGRTERMFASEYEGMIPDILVLGKRLTGGYLPLAITVISEKLFSAFDGSVADGKALAYGHSYTGNASGAENPLPQLGTCRFKGGSWRKRSAPMRIYCRNRNLARRDGRSHLHRSAASRPANQTNLECGCFYAATLHYIGSVKESRRSSPNVDHRRLALDQWLRKKRCRRNYGLISFSLDRVSSQAESK